MAFKKVALAGASGYLGRKVLDHLLTIPTLSQITVLTHSTSPDFPPSPILTVVSVPSYQDVAALTAALEGHDLLVSTLSSLAANEADEFLSSAVVAARVRRYMPSVLLPTLPNLKQLIGPITPRTINNQQEYADSEMLK